MGAVTALDGYVGHGHADLGSDDGVLMNLRSIGGVLVAAAAVSLVAQALLDGRSQTQALDGADAQRESVRRTTAVDAAVSELRPRLARGEASVAEHAELLARLDA